MAEKFAVFIDIDGTLTYDTGIHPDNAVAIKKARDEGHYIFINTGRAKSWINPKLLGFIEFDGVISGMGTLVEVGGKAIYEKLIDQSLIYSSAKQFWTTKNCFFISGVNKGFILNPLPQFADWHMAEFNSPEDFKGRYKDEKIQKIEMFGKDITEEDKQFFRGELDLYDHGIYFECCPKGCTKAGAMNMVLDYLGIDKAHSIAIGDSVNDIEVLENAGIAVAVGNAIDKVKDVADFVSKSCRDGGVAYAIEELLLKKK